jgi:hypothetical protein
MTDIRLSGRRKLLESALAASAMMLAGRPCRPAASGSSPILSAEHQRCVNRRRRIVVQYDCQTLFGLDFASWLDYRFRYIDEPGTQIDSVWWDMGRLGQVLYASKFLDQLSHPGLDKWRRQGIDLVGRLVEETRKRKLEVFWHHRVSEVDMDQRGEGAAWSDPPDPLKRAHPDWVLKTWWRHGLWNFAVPAVREHTVRAIEEVVRRYDFDGVQLDFARHVPCLPPGRQWELRHHVTELMRDARRMLLEQARKRGRPLLLAAKVPQNLDGCRVDGLDVERWALEGLVDIFTLGSRSMEVDLAAFRRIRAGRNIKLQPCFDDHHTTDGYRYPPIEVFRGVFANWWQQGADSVVTFNWSNAPPELAERLGDLPGPLSQRIAYHEVGSPETLRVKDKTFVVERRGGYPWAEGFFNRNDTAPLPMALRRGGEPGSVCLRIADDLRAPGGRLRHVTLRAVLFAPDNDEEVEVRLNGHVLPLALRDPAWKDPQILSPDPQPASGGSGVYKVNPRQRLLRLEFAAGAESCRLGENRVAIRVLKRPNAASEANVVLEKLECMCKR